MNFLPTKIPEVLLIEPQVYKDERGFFLESYQARQFAAAGITANFVQDNQSGSRRGMLRGLHYQVRQAQGKLLRVTVGEIYDIAVDLRRSSASFGKWVGLYLSAESQRLLWVPPGFAHGIYVTSEWAELTYKTTDYYAPEWERTLLWNDPELEIDWPLIEGMAPLLSPKDARGTPLSEAEVFD